jgi:hypothetical protein
MSHHITREHVQDWLDRYMRAWETYDPALIGDLFTEDAQYRWHPADDPTVGRAEIVDAWVNPGGNASSRDVPGTYTGRYEPYAVDGNRAVAIGVSEYWKDASRTELDRLYFNNWLLEFGDDGRCSSFIEYWMSPRKSA